MSDLDDLALRNEIENELTAQIDSVSEASTSEYKFEFADGSEIWVDFYDKMYDFVFDPGQSQASNEVAEHLKKNHHFKPL